MAQNIRIQAGKVVVTAELNDSPTAQKVYETLPIDGSVNTWGDEIYFEIPVSGSLDETARDVVEVGDLGYWPTGRAFCIFFGPTPASRGDEIRPASAVNVLGRCVSETAPLRQVRDGESVRIERG
jgi:hypothetical protein